MSTLEDFGPRKPRTYFYTVTVFVVLNICETIPGFYLCLYADYLYNPSSYKLISLILVLGCDFSLAFFQAPLLSLIRPEDAGVCSCATLKLSSMYLLW